LLPLIALKVLQTCTEDAYTECIINSGLSHWTIIKINTNMARVKGALQITGGIQGVSFYTMKGSDTIFMRTKGGPSKRRLKVGDEFKNVRLHQTEWGGCVRFSQYICRGMGKVYKLADYNVSPKLNGLGKRIMKLDTVHPLGTRSVQLSKCREVLEGFNLNRQYPFNSVYRTSLNMEIDKAHGVFTVRLPRINASNDIYNLQNLPYFRLVFCFTYLSDLEFDSEVKIGNRYKMTALQNTYWYNNMESEWISTRDITLEQTLEANLNIELSEEDMSVLTCIGAVGIQFAAVGLGGVIEPVKNACCGKILVSK